MPRPRLSGRRLAVAAGAVVAAAGVVAGALVAPASAGHPRASAPAVPAPPASPTSADQIQNIDQVKTAIRGYYGDTTTTTLDPVTGTTTLHTFSPTGAYAAEVSGIARKATHYLDRATANDGKPAIVLDVDDTSVNTYDYEIYSNFVYNPTTNAAFVHRGFPAVPGMVALADTAEAHGYHVFFLTGRPELQRTDTDKNLADLGYPVADDHVYLKDQTKPWLTSCAPTCTTIEYKSLTRAHIEAMGYDIVANFGDQYSDLKGGHADRSYKLPNPMYYLP